MLCLFILLALILLYNLTINNECMSNIDLEVDIISNRNELKKKSEELDKLSSLFLNLDENVRNNTTQMMETLKDTQKANCELNADEDEIEEGKCN